MKYQKFYIYSIAFLSFFVTMAQNKITAFKDGEALKYRIHYGIINAGYATLDVTEKENEFHFVGKGWTTGMTNLFFKVRDRYESFADKNTLKPNRFVRDVKEGGYTQNRDIYFDHENKTATVKDFKLNTTKSYDIEDIQDVVSSFYMLRNQSIDTMKIDTDIVLNLFIDAESFPFRLKLLGEEIVNSKFGKINCYKFRPLVQAERVFKEEESLTIWISADENKIPIRVKAKLAVGALKMDLDSYRGLANSFPIIYDK